uniref:NPC1 like intracellular cholesterol transporter 1 n=2 Tax=Latimeria chalumnae TaxID=7897 RepID=M3XGJ9_LATCH|nr:PREDICTED: Niemann-Pick C1-like protein 1 [Latimeria chalumnae]|eukprot:XP_014344420.1 PREDICTED: Niemann-Pick C1-like protein 1 [Latimeria chalumnae]
MSLKRVYVIVILCVILCLVSSSKVHKEGYCSFRDECGKNPNVANPNNPIVLPILPCVYNGPARKFSGSNLNKLKSICPMLYNGDNTYACCNSKQLDSLKKSLQLSGTILSRCPSCLENFVNIYCQNTCSPNQSLHVNVTKIYNATISGQVKEAVLEYQCYYSRQFADGSFDSCKNVRILSTGGYAISAMCGKYGPTLCNAQRWLDYQGDINNGLAPLDIDFRLIENGTTIGDGIVPYNGKLWKCSESLTPDGQACSCQDCPQSCAQIPPPAPPPRPFQIGQVDGVLVICIIMFCTFTALFVAFLMCSYFSRSKHKSQEQKVKTQRLTENDVPCFSKISQATQDFLENMFRKWGTIVARHPIIVIIISFIIVVALSAGLVFIELTTDPVELWSAPNSQARREKDFHDANFDPFFRTNQLIITIAKNSNYTYNSIIFGQKNFSSILSKGILLELLDLQTRLYNITVWSKKHQKTITLKDICFAPLNPNNPRTTDCAVNSLMQYFQNNRTNFEMMVQQNLSEATGTVDWRDHFLYCVNSPLSFQDITELSLSCMADYGAPVFPFLAVGGYEGIEFQAAKALIMTFSLNNYPRNDQRFEYVLLWEKKFLDIIQEYKQNKSSSVNIAYMAERSLEDEINRTTVEDLPIFAISYVVILVYIALALGEYSSWKRILIDSKVTLGLGGILVVLGAVLSSMGFYAYIGMPSSLIILQVVPFLVLAVGADNIFIFVLEYQRDERQSGEDREEQIGRVLGGVAPSMLLCSMSESICFFLGALTQMPAVRTFALYAALAVLFDFLLQMSAFVALLSLDARRQEGFRFDICCCVKLKNIKKKKNKGLLLPFMRNYYAPFLLHHVTRVIVMLVFLFMFCAGIFLMFQVKIGLDQELSMPTDSYMLEYFDSLNKYFEVGVPTYFVTTGGYNFASIAGMNGVCSSVGCDNNSLTQKIQYATKFTKESSLKIPSSSWVDDFIDWLNPFAGCCRLYLLGPNKDQFCPATSTAPLCLKPCTPFSTSAIRPTVDRFNKLLPHFLNDTPSLQCSKGGLGAYDKAVRIGKQGEILASRFMAYHTQLSTSQDYTAALKAVRELAANITESMRRIPGTDPNFEVFPYS